ncbi:AstB/chuR-related protein [Spironucleus salmonicida]|nr:AstB/chuR-related protein [Spironucleus salmonicida]
MPAKPTYDAKLLAERIKEDDDPVIVFYGGEPLVNIPFVMQVMDLIPDATFVLQSNCTLLHKLSTPYLLRFQCILVSIDGRPETVATYRGPTVYQSIIDNLEDTRQRGYTGHMIARMACSMNTDIYEDVTFLLEHPLKFDSIYWQLDAEWDYPMNIRWGDFEGYLRDSYKPGIAKLMQDLMRDARIGKFRQISPFAQIFETHLKNVPCDLRCGAGHRAVSIATDGKMLACPVAATEKWNHIGNLDVDKPKDVMKIQQISGPCEGCDIRYACGGRCLYANKTMHWKEQGYQIVCGTVRQLVDLVKENLDEMKQLIADGVIDFSNFEFPNERYSIETIP